ncbi:MAG TPA: GDP-mannose 4,6-dehydratase [Gemmatimonadaceae bacterium]|nr:GDP-mannose 4,6-dehydratase [Gemmatimonadaceae bacterium]
MIRSALVTGGNGFVAQWAARAMLGRGWRVTSAGIGQPSNAAVLDAAQRDGIRWVPMDITRQEEISAAVDEAQPDVVVHLAAISHVPDAMRNPGYAYEVNTVGTVRLLAELGQRRRAGKGDPVVLVVGSSEQYGRHELSDMPLSEHAEQRPLTLYAASKVAQEVAALQSFRSDGARVICTRSFSHSGTGHAENFLLPALVRRALLLPKSGGVLTIGNGDTVRDFLHVEDVVEAYLALLEQGVTGEVYNVCSGEGLSVRALAELVLQRVGVSADISSDRALARPVDVPVQIGSNAKLRRATGWAPRHTREDIIDDLIHAATR